MSQRHGAIFLTGNHGRRPGVLDLGAHVPGVVSLARPQVAHQLAFCFKDLETQCLLLDRREARREWGLSSLGVRAHRLVKALTVVRPNTELHQQHMG